MKRYLVLSLFVTQIGCSGLIEYTLITAGTLTGNILSEQYEDYQADLIEIQNKGEKDDKNNNK